MLRCCVSVTSPWPWTPPVITQQLCCVPCFSTAPPHLPSPHLPAALSPAVAFAVAFAVARAVAVACVGQGWGLRVAQIPEAFVSPDLHMHPFRRNPRIDLRLPGHEPQARAQCTSSMMK